MYLKFVFLSFLALSSFSVGCAENLAVLQEEATMSVENGSDGVATNTDITVNFNEPVQVRTVTTDSFFVLPIPEGATIPEDSSYDFSLCDDTSGAVAATILCSSSTSCTISFDENLEEGESYAVCLTSTITYEDPQTGLFSGMTFTFITVVAASDPDTYTVGGNISGLSGTVVLQNNDGDDLTITSNGDFTLIQL